MGERGGREGAERGWEEGREVMGMGPYSDSRRMRRLGFAAYIRGICSGFNYRGGFSFRKERASGGHVAGVQWEEEWRIGTGRGPVISLIYL